MADVILLPGKEKRVYSGHPWVFRSDIARTKNDPQPGDTVRVTASNGRFLCMAAYNPHSQIALRVLSYKDEPIDEAFIRGRVHRAVEYRRRFADLRSCRLIFAESDGLPAVIVDSFGDVLSLQCLCLGMEKYKDMICDALMDEVHPQGIYERGDVPVRELENYYGEKISYRNVPLSTETILAGIKGRTLDMTVNVRPANGSSMYRSFRINLAKDGEHVTTVKYKPEQGIVRVDRSRCGFRFDIVHVREFPVYSKHGNIKLRCVLDRHSLELFVNDGEQAASFVLHTDVSADVISFEADGEVLMDVEKYDLVFNPEDE